MEISIQKMLMNLLLTILKLLKWFLDLFEWLAGMSTEVSTTPENYFLTNSVVMRVFLMIFAASMMLLFVMVMSTVIKSMIGKKTQNGEIKSPIKALGQGLMSIISTLAIAAIMLLGIGFSSVLLIEINNSFNKNSGDTIGETVIIAIFDTGFISEDFEYFEYPSKKVNEGTEEKPVYKYIKTYRVYPYERITGEGKWYIKYIEIIDEVEVTTEREIVPFEKDYLGATTEGGSKYWWVFRDHKYYFQLAGTLQPVDVSDTIGEYKKLETQSKWLRGVNHLDIENDTADILIGEYKYSKVLGINIWPNKEGLITNSNRMSMANFNMLVPYFGACVILVVVVMSLLGLVKRLFELVMLFIGLPLVTATIPADDGARFGKWRETVISKVLLSYGIVISINVFTIFVKLIVTDGFEDIVPQSLGNMLPVIRLVMIVAGGMTISSSQMLVARILGTDASEFRDANQGVKGLLGGAALAAKGVKTAGGLAASTAKLGTGIVGKSANAVGNLVGGSSFKQGKEKLGNAIRGVGNNISNKAANLVDRVTGGNGLAGAFSGGGLNQFVKNQTAEGGDKMSARQMKKSDSAKFGEMREQYNQSLSNKSSGRNESRQQERSESANMKTSAMKQAKFETMKNKYMKKK